MSLTAGIVIVLVLLTRLPLKKAPKIFSYALWAVVLFRLLCPISFSSDFSLLGASMIPP
jgi:beta-lactamase regulating signal transducer with metallopeptidase domain